jgi:hypothetical protein
VQLGKPGNPQICFNEKFDHDLEYPDGAYLLETTSPPKSTLAVVTRASLVDFESAPLQAFAIKPGDCGLGFETVWHLHKSKSPRIAGVLIFDDFNRSNLPEGFKSVSQIFFSGLSQ